MRALANNIFRYAVDSFVEHVKAATARHTMNYRCNDADIKAWNHWCERYGVTSVGENLVDQWLEFAMASWFDKEAPADYSRKIRFSWVFGEAAQSRWDSLSRGTKRHIVHKNKDVVRRKKNTCNNTVLKQALVCVRAVEEVAKQRYYNTKRGLLWCVANTTLYNHASGLCLNCVYKEQCKITLKKEYPQLYASRGYH